ncbi:MAG TPA: hypothetical protein VIC60_02590 [Thermomicrobiales bacterium]
MVVAELDARADDDSRRKVELVILLAPFEAVLRVRDRKDGDVVVHASVIAVMNPADRG